VKREYLDRSSGGLWVKGVMGDDSIGLFWKPRFVTKGSRVEVYDFNGEIEATYNAGNVDWGEEWRSCGDVPLVDDMVEMSGLDAFRDFSFAIMRHAVRLVVCGYGDTPSDAIEMFSDFKKKDFVVEDKYQVIGDHGEFSGLSGNIVRVVREGDDEKLVGHMQVREQVFSFGLEDPKLFTSFFIATRLF